MAEEILVKELLTSEMILGGENLTILLDNTDLNITASFWFYSVVNMRWKLIFGISQVWEEGPLKSITTIHKLLRDNPIDGVDFSDLRIVQSEHSMIRRLKALAKTGKGLKGIRITQTVVDGELIQDAYVYRLMRSSDNGRRPKYSKATH